MTFESSAWAIDGARVGGAVARRAEFAATSGEQGIVQAGDLAVSALATPGQGIQIAPGVGLVLNKYQNVPNEIYVVSNPNVHTIPADEMPASNASAKSYIVAVVVGDPKFSQTGHPFMGGVTIPTGEAETFQYVRVMLIPCAAGATTIAGRYPNLPLARIDVPANTTTIQQSHITRLTKLARPRQTQMAFVSPTGLWTNAAPQRMPSGTNYADWGGQFKPSVTVPSWAKRAIVICSVNGVVIGDRRTNLFGGIRAQLGNTTAGRAYFDSQAGSGTDMIRDNYTVAGQFDVSGLAGQTLPLRIEGYLSTPASPNLGNRPALQAGSQQVFDVRFFEE